MYFSFIYHQKLKKISFFHLFKILRENKIIFDIEKINGI